MPVGNQTVFGQQDKQVAGIEADFNRLVHDEHMTHILLAAADFILTLNNQDTVRNENPVRFRHTVNVETVQFRLAGKHSKTAVEAIANAAFQRLSLCGEKRRIEFLIPQAGFGSPPEPPLPPVDEYRSADGAEK